MLRWLTRQYYSKTILPILSCQITAAAAFQQLVSVSLLHMLLHLLLERWERAELDLLGCVAKLPLESEAWRHKHPAIVKQGGRGGRKREALIDYANALLLTATFSIRGVDAAEAEAGEAAQPQADGPRPPPWRVCTLKWFPHGLWYTL